MKGGLVRILSAMFGIAMAGGDVAKASNLKQQKDRVLMNGFSGMMRTSPMNQRQKRKQWRQSPHSRPNKNRA